MEPPLHLESCIWDARMPEGVLESDWREPPAPGILQKIKILWKIRLEKYALLRKDYSFLRKHY